MVIGWALLAEIVTGFPFFVADPLLNWTVPKLSRGVVLRPLLGASSIHSTEEREEEYETVV